MNLILFLFSSILFAAPRPEMPEPGVDRVLTEGLSSREFFEKRASKTTCFQALEKDRIQYRTERAELFQLKKSGASASTLDAKERKMLALQKALLLKVEDCGECATRPVESVNVPTPQKTELWYIADGSCQLPTRDKNQLELAYQTSLDILLDAQKYPAKNGGFSSVLEFSAVDMTAGELLPEIGKFPAEPFHTFVGVKGPVIVAQLGFQYIGKTNFFHREKNGLKELVITMRGVEFPQNFEPPTMYVEKASGKKDSVVAYSLKTFQIMWYLNSDGYSRYYTAADFGQIVSVLSFLKDFARETLGTTLFQQVERSLGKQ